MFNSAFIPRHLLLFLFLSISVLFNMYFFLFVCVPTKCVWLFCICVCMLSRFSSVQLREILWTVARQAPLPMEFPRQEYWSGLPCPSPGNLPDPGIELESFKCPALTGRFFTTSATWEVYMCLCECCSYLILLLSLLLAHHLKTHFCLISWFNCYLRFRGIHPSRFL